MHASKRDQRVLFEGVCASWVVHDVAAVKACVHAEAVYKHYLPQGVWPIPGEVRGKPSIARSLAHFLQEFHVCRYQPLRIGVGDRQGLLVSSIAFKYEHRATGHSFDGTARVKTQFDGDKIMSLEIFHDAPRVHAFLELVSCAGVEA